MAIDQYGNIVREWTFEEEQDCQDRYGDSCDGVIASGRLQDGRYEEIDNEIRRLRSYEDADPILYTFQSVTVSIPPPEPGERNAKVYIINEYGKSEEVDYRYPELNYNNCDDTDIPPVNSPTVFDGDLENAYTECIEDVADLFCEPSPAQTSGVSAWIETMEIQNPNPDPGGRVLYSFTKGISDPIGVQTKGRIGKLPFQITLRNRTLIAEENNPNRPQFRQDVSFYGSGGDKSWVQKSKGVFELNEPIVFADFASSSPTVVGVLFTDRSGIILPNNFIGGDEIEMFISLICLTSPQGPRVDSRSMIVKTRTTPADPIVTLETKIPYKPADDNDFSDGKKELFISTNLVGDLTTTIDSYIESYVGNFHRGQVGKFFPDKTREYYGSFWMREGTTPEMLTWVANHPSNSFKIAQKPDGFMRQLQTSFYNLVGRDPSINSSTLFQRSGVYTNYVSRFVEYNLRPPSSLFKDITYVIQKPYTPKEAEKANLLYSSRIIDIKTEYNFYNRRYEEIHFNQNESLLPNMYFLLLNDMSMKTAKTEDEEDDLEIDPAIKKIIRLRDETPDDIAPLRVNSYYDYYVEKIRQNDVSVGDTYMKSRNIVVPYKFLDGLEDLSQRNQSFPMFVDIKFDTSPMKQVGNLIKKSNYKGERLYLQIIENFSNSAKSEKVTQQEMYKIQYEGETRDFLSTNVRYIDFIDALAAKEVTDRRIDQFMYLGNYKDYLKTPSAYVGFGFSVFNVGTNAIGNQSGIPHTHDPSMISQIREIIRNKLRSYEQIIENKKCYVETLFYRIAKYKYSQTPNGEAIIEQEPIQNIYIPNDPDKNYLRYIDTQVKYGKKYLYRIYSYDFVITNEYSNWQLTNYIAVSNDIKPLVIENIYDEFVVKVSDRPPVPPETSIKTFKDTDNKILFLLNRGTSTFKTKEQPILDSDSLVFQKARESQRLEENELIEFSGDDIIEKYQIFKTTKPPSRYEDFSTAELIEVNTRIDRANPNLRTVASSYLDKIKPNVKYYYTVRCVDIHQQISNPGMVYEIEIVNDSGMIFPIIKEWKFPEIEQKMSSKSFKRFLMIKPSGQQTFLEIDDAAEEDIATFVSNPSKIKIGKAEETVWNKTYKMRLVSKNTKKIYDIKFSFDTDKQIIE